MGAVGVALFSDVGDTAPGWACVAGEAAEEFGSWHDLPQDVRWLSNLDFQAHRSMRLFQVAHIHDSQYLRANINVLRSETGERALGPASELLSRLAGRVMRLGSELLDAEPERQRHHRYVHVVQRALKDAGFRSSTATGQARMDVAPGTAARGAHQINQKRVTEMGRDPVRYFSAPRQAFFRWLLGQSYPACEGSWEFRSGDAGFTASELDDEHLDGVAKLAELNAEYAGFARVRVSHPHPDFVEWGLFGAGSDGLRDWATLPEALSVARYSRVRISDLLLTQRAPLPMPAGLRRALDGQPEFACCSSFGLLLENVAAGYSQKAGGKSPPTPVACYLHAYMRAWALDLAFVLEQAGLRVGSFAYGRIVGRVSPEDEDNVMGCALANGIVPQGWNRSSGG